VRADGKESLLRGRRVQKARSCARRSRAVDTLTAMIRHCRALSMAALLSSGCAAPSAVADHFAAAQRDERMRPATP